VARQLVVALSLGMGGGNMGRRNGNWAAAGVQLFAAGNWVEAAGWVAVGPPLGQLAINWWRLGGNMAAPWQ